MSKSIHVTGALGDADEPFEWMDELEGKFPEHEFVNAFELNEHDLGAEEVYENPDTVIEPSKKNIEGADGVLARWEEDVPLPGTDMEILYAWQHDVPVVVWYDGWRDDLPLWLNYHTKGSWSERDQCVAILLGLLGDDSYIA